MNPLARKGGQWNPALKLLEEVDWRSLEVQAKRFDTGALMGPKALF